MPTTIKPKVLNKTIIDGGCYLIHEAVPGKEPTTRKVEAVEIAYDRIGVRHDGKTVILDHIPTGWMIGKFKSEARARQAIRELIQVTDFKWIVPPVAIRSQVQEILKRLGQ